MITHKTSFLFMEYYGTVGSVQKQTVLRYRENMSRVKCIIFDLDNTLWDGVVLEGNTVLKPEIPRHYRTCIRKINVQNSKMDETKKGEVIQLYENIKE